MNLNYSPISGLAEKLMKRETNEQKKCLSQLRTRMLDLKANYQGSHSNLDCELCQKHTDDQESLLSCEKLAESTHLVLSLPKYNDLFTTDVDKQFGISAILEEKFKLKKKFRDNLKKQ